MINFADVFDDAQIAEQLICSRYEQVVGPDGRAVNYPKEYKFNATVTNAEPDVVERLADAGYVSASINVHTAFRLTAGTVDTDADVVVYQGTRYRVKSVLDYSQFGYVQAMCKPITVMGE
jgi:hypothetical protein